MVYKPYLDDQEFPPEIDTWSWAAYQNGPWWAIRNKLPRRIILISFIPIYGNFYTGNNGNKFLWKHGNWESIEHFKNVQKEQSSNLRTGLWLFIGAPLVILIGLIPIVLLIKALS